MLGVVPWVKSPATSEAPQANAVLLYGHVVKLTSKYLIYTNCPQPWPGQPCWEVAQLCRDL